MTKTALITGASSGIGVALARQFAEQRQHHAAAVSSAVGSKAKWLEDQKQRVTDSGGMGSEKGSIADDEEGLTLSEVRAPLLGEPTV